MISRSSGRRLLPERAVCPLPPRPEVFPCFPPRPTIRSFLFLCTLVRLCICIKYYSVSLLVIFNRLAGGTTSEGVTTTDSNDFLYFEEITESAPTTALALFSLFLLLE